MAHVCRTCGDVALARCSACRELVCGRACHTACAAHASASLVPRALRRRTRYKKIRTAADVDSVRQLFEHQEGDLCMLALNREADDADGRLLRRLGVIGRGRQGAAYEACVADCQYRAVLKVSGADARAEAENEVRMLQRLTEERVRAAPALYAAWTCNDEVHALMEWIDGVTVQAWLSAALDADARLQSADALARERRIKSRRLLRSLLVPPLQPSMALDAAGVFHTDSHLDNVIAVGAKLDATAIDTVRFIDFGRATAHDTPLAPGTNYVFYLFLFYMRHGQLLLNAAQRSVVLDDVFGGDIAGYSASANRVVWWRRRIQQSPLARLALQRIHL